MDMLKVVDPKGGAEVEAPVQIWIIALYSVLTEGEKAEVLQGIKASWPPRNSSQEKAG